MAVLARNHGLGQPHVDGQDAQCLHSFVILDGVVLLCLQALFQNPFEVAFSLVLSINVLYN